MKNVLLLAVATVICCAAPLHAQENCVCVDDVMYCVGEPSYDYEAAPTYEYVPDFEAETPSYYSPYDGSNSPQTQSTAPIYTTYSYDPSPSQVPPELIVMGLIALAAVVIVAACSPSQENIEKDTDEIQALTSRLEADAREADKHIASYLDKVRSEGNG